MERVQVPIKKIENITNRQITFSKRRNDLVKKAYELSVLCDVMLMLLSSRSSLMADLLSSLPAQKRYINLPPQECQKNALVKKAYELSVLCDVDIALMTFSPSNRLALFSSSTRVKVPTKKIKNITNRQITFSKRRNGLIKTAYELSVLCDVDVALITFSPSDSPALFFSSTSFDEILEPYINLPPQERQNPVNSDFQLELEEMEKRLRWFLQTRDQQSHSAVVDMLSTSSTLVPSTNTFQLQMNPENNSSEVCTLSPEFGQVIDINGSSWEQFHDLGNGSLSIAEAREQEQLIEQYLSQFPSSDILISNQHHKTL
ncbi:hypothetical protein Ahy_A07g033097 [Arachis hypogaea]|uniref:MADS-box domain-containing protein n=1 Tax=Arachis hypogaea TaxID=3818 RepID=A0A445C8G0_ARAHY|nr:hypothetical protein Ahy_A07g033097 [Arachis hypogaea]